MKQQSNMQKQGYLWLSKLAVWVLCTGHRAYDTIPTRNGRELGEIWVSKVGTNF